MTNTNKMVEREVGWADEDAHYFSGPYSAEAAAEAWNEAHNIVKASYNAAHREQCDDGRYIVRVYVGGKAQKFRDMTTPEAISCGEL